MWYTGMNECSTPPQHKKINHTLPCLVNMVSACPSEGSKEMFYLTTHSTHFYLWLYGIGHMVKTTQIGREKTRCHHYMGYSFWLAAMVLLYAPSHRQDSNTICGALVWMSNILMVKHVDNAKNNTKTMVYSWASRRKSLLALPEFSSPSLYCIQTVTTVESWLLKSSYPPLAFILLLLFQFFFCF